MSESTESDPPDDLPNPYRAVDTPGLQDEIAAARALVAEFNRLSGVEPETARRVLERLLGSLATDAEVRGPIACDLGRNISIGEGTFINSGFTALDIAPIEIGEVCNIGPNVSLVTPTHPIDPGARLDEWEGSAPVTICDNVWIGAGSTVLPGVTIGDGAVVGAGSVVVADVPAGQIAVGNPARVIRSVATRRRPAVFTCLVTCPVESADDLATALVEAGNAACVNLVDPVRSVYRWRGKIEHGREALLVVKTTRPRLFALESQLREIHPSEVHELVCLPVEAGSNPYLDWVADSVSQPDYPS